MPYSSNNGKSYIDRTMRQLIQPHLSSANRTPRILDIGAGCGTYSDRYRTWMPNAHWLAVEIFEPYVARFALASKYNEVLISPALSAVLAFVQVGQRFDICFLGDVLEHMDKSLARLLVEELQKICTTIIISLPIGDYPQGPSEGNVYEAHLSTWTHEECCELWKSPGWAREGEIGVYVVTSPEVGTRLKPKVAVYTICKNEHPFVARWIDQAGRADHVVVVDTGSTDGTDSAFEDCAANSPNIKLYRTHIEPWRFDDARNTALALVPPWVDLCISLDLDEELPEHWEQVLQDQMQHDWHSRGQLHDTYHCRFATVWDWKDTGNNISRHWHQRIHTRYNWRWKLPVHEFLSYTGTSQLAEQHISNLELVQKPDLSKPRSNYLPLLEQSVKEDPTVWRSWWFLAELRKAQNDGEGAWAALGKAKECEGADQAFLLYQESLWTADVHAAAKIAVEAAHNAPNSREYAVYAALAWEKVDDKNVADYWIRRAKECTVRTDHYSFNHECWDEAFEQLYARLTGQEGT